jgi:hypothetical protein
MSAVARRMSPAALRLWLSSNKAIAGQPIEVGFHSGAPYAMQESKRLHPLSRRPEIVKGNRLIHGAEPGSPPRGFVQERSCAESVPLGS